MFATGSNTPKTELEERIGRLQSALAKAESTGP